MWISLNAKLKTLAVYFVILTITVIAPQFVLKGAANADDHSINKLNVAVERVFPAVVLIKVVSLDPREGKLNKYNTAGSGVIISSDGYVITNFHVAAKSARLVCHLANHEQLPAKLVGVDALTDIAILKLDLSQRKADRPSLPFVAFGDSDKVKVGDTVFAMGSPQALSQSVTKGIVSNAVLSIADCDCESSLRIDGESVSSLVRWIAHDADIYGGNSGGPLVNKDGEVIGINEIRIGLGGAIPGNLAKQIANEIITQGEVRRSWIGLEVQPLLKKDLSQQGVLVRTVYANSPAEKTGILPGDIITEFDGSPVNATFDVELPLFNQIAVSTPIGKTIRIKVLRDTTIKEFSLTTEAAENTRANYEELKPWGMVASNLTRTNMMQAYRNNRLGVLVHSIRPGGPVGESKPALRKNDIVTSINGQTITDIQHLQSLSSSLTKDKAEPVPVLVMFERDDAILATVVKIGDKSSSNNPLIAKHAWLPVETQVLTKDLAKSLGLSGEKGMRITRVYPDRSAAKAGLQIGDVLLQVDGQTIDASSPQDSEVLQVMIKRYKPGTEAVFDILRNGTRLKLTIGLEETLPGSSELETFEDKNLEMTIRELSFHDRLRNRLSLEQGGVIVEKVERAGWAALAELKDGDIILSINDQKILDVTRTKELLSQFVEKKTGAIKFFIKRGVEYHFLQVEPGL